MRRALPSRTAVLDVIESEDRPIRVRELADKLDVEPTSIEGLLRLLDDLVFDGVLRAEGDRYQLERHRSGKKSLPPEPLKLGKKSLPSEPPKLGKKGPSEPPKAGKKKLISEHPKAGNKGVPYEFKSAKKGLPLGFRTPRATSSDGERFSQQGFRAQGSERFSRRGAFEGRSADRDRDRDGERRLTSSRQREGVLTVNPRGFGFVASPTATGDDVFVNADSLGNAMHGDHVVVEIVARGSRGAEGRIVEVKKRAATRVSGILRRKGKNAWVELDDPRVRGPVVLTREMDTEGPEGNSGISGQVVVAEITRFPEEPNENPEGKLIAVLGQPGDLSVEVNKVLFLAQIEEVHSSEAIAEAEAYGLEVPDAMLAGREDLTHLPLPTIDPEDARDHDDAVWVQRTEGGGYEVWVAIADVSSYVRPETKIDEEAKARGTSIYLPDRAIPMLPRALSSNLCSLLPDVTRLCLCVYAELDAKGAVKSTRLIRGFMRSQAKLTYGGVARALGFTSEPPRDPKAEEHLEGLRVAHEVSRILRGRRMKRGALDFDLPEPVVKLDAEGKPANVTKRAKDEGVKKAYQLIEELMIFANEVVARWLIEHVIAPGGKPMDKRAGVFRVHLPPDPKKLERLAAMCDVLGIDLDVEETQTPKGLANILAQFADHPSAQVLNSLLLRSMKQASYDVANLGHFGLASEAYLHFTSPIRRYPDLVVHRIVHAALDPDERARKKLVARAADAETLQEAAIASSMAERRAMEVEREVLDVYRCFYMIDHIGETFEGTVSAFVGTGAFITLDDPFVDVLIKTEDLGPNYTIEDDGLSATSGRGGETIHLGDRFLVEIIDVALLRRQVQGRRLRGDGEPIGRSFGERPFARGPHGRKDRSGRGERDDRGQGASAPGRTRKGKPLDLHAKPGKKGKDKKGKGGPSARSGKPKKGGKKRR